MPDPAQTKIRNLNWRIAFSAVCAGVFVARLAFPAWFEDLTAADYLPLVLAGLPWLGLFVSELKLPGGVEAKFAELTEKVAAAQAEAQAAQAKAQVAQDEAVESKAEARILAVTAGPAPGPREIEAAADGTAEASLRALGARYAETRAAMPSGTARTAAMTAIVRDMVAAAQPDAAGRYAAGFAAADEDGLRLAAAAWSVAHPDRAETAPLVAALYASGQPFVQYWLLSALDQIAERRRDAFSPTSLEKLAGFERHASTGSDRKFLLKSILRKLGS